MSEVELPASPKRHLNLFDCVCVIVTIIVGVGVFETTPLIAASLGEPWLLLIFWLLGGIVSLCGALCYAELGSAYPDQGGDYEYLRQAFGSLPAFLFGWSNFLIVRPGTIAALSFPFAHYLAAIISPEKFGLSEASFTPLAAVLLVVALTAANVARLSLGKVTQNLLLVIKLLGITTLIAVALLCFPPEGVENLQRSGNGDEANYYLALILVLFTYGGWNEIGYVAAEVKEPRRNLRHALVIGLLLVSAVYILLNTAFLVFLGIDGMAASSAVADDMMQAAAGPGAARLISLLVCLSALGAVSAAVFTGSRVFFVLGRDFPIFNFVSKWNAKNGPVSALIVQGVLSTAVILLFGTFERTVIYTTTVVWLFFLLTALAIFRLRGSYRRRKDVSLVPLYPIIPIVHTAACAGALWSAFQYDAAGSFISLGILILGLVPYWISKSQGR